MVHCGLDRNQDLGFCDDGAGCDGWMGDNDWTAVSCCVETLVSRSSRRLSSAALSVSYAVLSR
jgi:hypothetical protein